VTFDLQDSRVQEYFSTARERYEIFLRRKAGVSPPYTEDPAFRDWRFCNVFREDDRVTVWIRENVRDRLQENPHVLLAMVTCRLFNRIETMEILNNNGLFDRWDSRKARKLLHGIEPIVGAAYVIKTPDGMNKLDGVLYMVDAVKEDALHLATHGDYAMGIALEGIWEVLQTYPCIGRFIAYEIVSDLRHTYIGRKATDIRTWANPGPGACRGLSFLVNDDLESIQPAGRNVREKIVKTMMKLLDLSNNKELWPTKWPRWEMREVEHWLCEYAKWVKVTHLGMRMKRRF